VRRLCKFLALLAATLFFVFVLLIGRTGLFLSPPSERRFLARATHWWSKSSAIILGLKVTHSIIPGDFLNDHFLIAANHQSYLDVVVLGSIFPTLFVAKSDVKNWPIIGWLVTLAGTLYVDRKAFRGTINAVRTMEQILSQGTSIQIFPEGTSTNGDLVLPFKPSLFSAAIPSHTKILPVTIRYLATNNAPIESATKDYVRWYGNMNFVGHFWKMLDQEYITASVTIHPVIPSDHYPEIKQIAELAHYYVSKC
jgi:1-acyl-sn-glycerol-3-phosphate acyltransferase